MPQDPQWAVQTALYSRLCADTGVTGLLAAGAGGVFDHVPQGSPFPYIALGDSQARPHETQDGGGHDITLDIHSFSRLPGMKETRALQSALMAALHEADFAVTGHRLILCRVVAQAARLAADGETRHGTLTLRIVTEPN